MISSACVCHHMERTSEYSEYGTKEKYAVGFSLQDVLNEFTPFTSDLMV